MTASTAALVAGFGRAEWTSYRFWVESVGIGGRLRRGDIDAILTGRRAATAAEHDILAAALNGYLVDSDPGHPVPYWSDLVV